MITGVLTSQFCGQNVWRTEEYYTKEQSNLGAKHCPRPASLAHPAKTIKLLGKRIRARIVRADRAPHARKYKPGAARTLFAHHAVTRAHVYATKTRRATPRGASRNVKETGMWSLRAARRLRLSSLSFRQTLPRRFLEADHQPILLFQFFF